MFFVSRILVFLFLVSCAAGIKWSPDFFIGDSANEQIINELGFEVKCNDIRFDRFACLSEQKVKELKEILIKARIPKSDKENALKILEMPNTIRKKFFK